MRSVAQVLIWNMRDAALLVEALVNTQVFHAKMRAHARNQIVGELWVVLQDFGRIVRVE